MNTTSRNFGWVKDSLIIILVMMLLVNWKMPSTEYVYVQEPTPIYIEIEKEHVEEVEKCVYIEIPMFIEVKPDEKKEAEKKVLEYKPVKVPGASGFKSYMRYTAITTKSSPQYKLQQLAYTDVQGFRAYEGRYCVAVGTGVGAKVGTYLDVILANGTHIPCIVGDIKANAHTDATNMFGTNGCCCEFLIDNDHLISTVKQSGDCSFAKPEWQSPVIAINVIERSVF